MINNKMSRNEDLMLAFETNFKNVKKEISEVSQALQLERKSGEWHLHKVILKRRVNMGISSHN